MIIYCHLLPYIGKLLSQNWQVYKMRKSLQRKAFSLLLAILSFIYIYKYKNYMRSVKQGVASTVYD